MYVDPLEALYIILKIRLWNTILTNTCTDGVPNDGVPIEKTVTVHVSMTVIFSAASAIGIIFAIACVLFNFVHRNKK